MKIAYCIPSLYHSGGMERVLTLKANYLAEELKYDVTIILTDGKDKCPYFPLSKQVKVIQLDVDYEELFGLPLHKRLMGYWKKQILFKKKLSRCLYELRPDITVSLLRREINFINTIRDGSRKIGEIHFSRMNYRDLKNEKTAGWLRKWIAWLWMEQLLRQLKRLDRFVVLTEEDRKCWKELSNVVVIPNPVSFFPEQAASGESKQVIAVGRYSYEKGYDRLLEAWQLASRLHPDWTLAIYGGGDRAPLIEQAERLGIAATCRFEPPADQIMEKYQASAFSVLASRYEGFGMVITEAMACGIPVVAFDCPCGPRDIIRDGEDGFLVKDGDIEALANRICWLMEQEDQRKQMGRQARLNVKRFSIEQVARQWDSLFRSVV